jgi:ABC-type branched-subunit amino acid transport system ATPase component
MSLLQIENVSSGYGKKEVLHHISMDMGKAEIVTLIGSNGAGKSTLLKVTYGLNAIWNEGSVLFDGADISRAKPEHLLQKGIVYIGQKHNTFASMSVDENLKTAGYAYSKDVLAQKIERLYALLPQLKTLTSKKTGELSGGQKQLVALSMGLLHEPKLVLFDEPSAGLDVKNMHEIFTIIHHLKEHKGISFLIVEHRIKEIAKITDRWIGLKLGRKIYDDVEIDQESLNDILL